MQNEECPEMAAQRPCRAGFLHSSFTLLPSPRGGFGVPTHWLSTPLWVALYTISTPSVHDPYTIRARSVHDPCTMMVGFRVCFGAQSVGYQNALGWPWAALSRSSRTAKTRRREGRKPSNAGHCFGRRIYLLQ